MLVHRRGEAGILVHTRARVIVVVFIVAVLVVKLLDSVQAHGVKEGDGLEEGRDRSQGFRGGENEEEDRYRKDRGRKISPFLTLFSFHRYKPTCMSPPSSC